MTRKVKTRDGKVVVHGVKVVTASCCLPDTITVALSGFADQFPDRSEIPMVFTSCFGSGAAGRVAAPSPEETPGAVSAPVITSGGSGYAVFGRVAPNVRLTVNGTGSGAVLTPVLLEGGDFCDRPYWYFDSVTIDAAGEDYDGTTTISIQLGSFPDYLATAGTVTGTGAVIHAVWYQDGDFWECSGTDILVPGSGYTVGDTFNVVTGLTLTVASVGGSGEILTLTVNQTGTFPALDTFTPTAPTLTPVLPRYEPTLTLDVLASEADLTVVMQPLDIAPLPLTWEVASVTVNDGGLSGAWYDEQWIYVAADPLNTESEPAWLKVRTVREEPDITAEAYGGTGATLTVNLSLNAGPPSTWSVDTITVDTPGTGHTDGESVSFNALGVTALSFAAARIRTVRASPTITADLSGASGSSGVLSVSLTPGTDIDGRDIWAVSGLTVDTAGTGYAVSDPISFTVTDGQEVFAGSGTITSVGGSGEITGVSVDYGGEYFKDTGVVGIVVVDVPGEYFKDTGVIESIEVADPGVYWENGDSIESVEIDEAGVFCTEDPAEPPILADVTVSLAGSGGTGVDIDAEINDDTSSPQFGQIEGATLNSGGTGYTGTVWVKKCCGDFYDGKTIVLKKGEKCGAAAGNTTEPDADGRMEPVVAVTPVAVSGTGAAFSVTLSPVTSWDIGDEPPSVVLRSWRASAASVASAGSGYTVGDTFAINATDGVTEVAGEIEVTAVNGTGGITSLSITISGYFYKDDPNVDVSPNNVACRFEHRHCTYNNRSGKRDFIHVQYRSEDLPPLVVITDTDPSSSDDTAPNASCSITLTSTTLVGEGDPFEFTATAPGGATAVVTEGGVYDAEDDYAGGCSCKKGCDGLYTPPEELTVAWARGAGITDDTIVYNNNGNRYVPPSGDYVLDEVTGSPCSTARGAIFSWAPFGTERSAGFSVSALPCREWSGASISVDGVDAAQDDPAPGDPPDPVQTTALRCNSCEATRINVVASVFYRIQTSCDDVCVEGTGCLKGRSWDFYGWADDTSVPGVAWEWKKIGTLTIP